MGSREKELNQRRAAAPSQGQVAGLSRWVRSALCAGALLSATACSEDAQPAPDTDKKSDEAKSGDDDTQADDEADDESKDEDEKPIDAGSKPAVDASKSNGKMDGGNVVITPTSDASSADAKVSTGGPLPLPTPDQAGPYEVVKVENVGKGFENPPTAANDRGDGAGCTGFIQMFGETAEAARDYALFGPDYKVDLYTLYYPKDMPEGARYPILSWANGTCAKTVGYEALLKHLASHGFIVVATNSRYTAGGKFQLRGVDFIAKENDNPESPLYKHVDVEKVGVFGHSQGGGSTWSAAADKRVDTSVVLNAGGSGTRPTPSYFVTGDKDLGPEGSLTAAKAQTAAAAIRLHKIPGEFPSGHITLMKEPARVNPSVTAWFRYQLLGDEVGKSWFVGSDCKLCNQPEEWDFFAKGLN